MNLKYLTLLTFALLFTISSQNAFAVNSISWIADGGLGGSSSTAFPPFDSIPDYFGNIILTVPLSISIDASDEGFALDGNIDTITVHITSVDDPVGTDYILTESSLDDGIFAGANFVFLNGNYKFQTTDIVNAVYTVDPTSSCGSDNTITQLDSRGGGSNDGLKVYSDTDLGGVGLVLTETDINTCTFEGQVKFTTTGTSDENTGTLLVSQGDILSFEVGDSVFKKYFNGQIIPTVPRKGSIEAHFDDPYDDDNTAEVTATYNGLSAGLDLDDGGFGGTGSGGAVRPGLVLNAIGALSGGSTASAPPTLGLDKNQKRIVDDGFSFNGNKTDVKQYYTPYPLITTGVGESNTIKLKIYEDRGPNNIAHVGLSYGLGKGETFNEGRATIEYDKTFDGIESVTLFDPKDVLGAVNVTTSQVQCSESNRAMCLEVTFNHIFRESLEYNMVATNIWDFQRNGWQNYFNHGVQITGESMNPPEQYSGIYKGHIYHLTETGKNTAVDDDANTWTFDKIWNRDYIKPVTIDSDILNQDKINAIEKMGFSYSDGQKIFGFERIDHRFADAKGQQKLEADKIMADLCPECQEKPFEKINDIFSYDFPSRHSKIDESKMNQENLKAQEFLKQYFEKIYPGKVFD